MKVLVTGGAGYIGSAIVTACLEAGIEPVVLDDFSTGRIEAVSGLVSFRGDVADGAAVEGVFRHHPDIDAVVHCAAMVSGPESLAAPLGYYRANVGGTVDLLRHVLRNGCRRIVFASSAAVYAPEPVVDEDTPLEPTTPYGHTKAMAERILSDVANAGLVQAVCLRYFNVIGADHRTGPHVRGDVLSRMLQAWRAEEPFAVTGTDWPTRDGTGVRDYVHVRDIARAHIAVLNKLDALPSYVPINLGTGRGTSVRELATLFESYLGGEPLKQVDGPARPGDIAMSVSGSRRASELLDWQPTVSIGAAIDELTSS